MKNLTFELLFLIFIVSTVYFLYLAFKLFDLLKVNHYQAWVDLRKPSNSISKGISSINYLLERRYESLDDESLITIANKVRRLYVFNCTYFYILMAVILSITILGQFA